MYFYLLLVPWPIRRLHLRHRHKDNIRHQSLQYILKAESIGYGLDVCGYVKTDIGLTHLSGGKTDFGTIPKPDLLVCNFSGCSFST